MAPCDFSKSGKLPIIFMLLHHLSIYRIEGAKALPSRIDRFAITQSDLTVALQRRPDRAKGNLFAALTHESDSSFPRLFGLLINMTALSCYARHYCNESILHRKHA